MELDAYQIIKGPLITEKLATAQERNNTYGFKVDKRANKIQIRQAVESIWDVKVVDVRTMTRKGKPRRVRWAWHHQPDTKVALVRLAADDRIE